MHASPASPSFHETFADTETTARIAISMAARDHGNPGNHSGFFVPPDGRRPQSPSPARRDSARAVLVRPVRPRLERAGRNYASLARAILGDVCALRALLPWSEPRPPVANAWTSQRPPDRAVRTWRSRRYGGHVGNHARRSEID